MWRCERFYQCLSFWLPRRLVYWCGIRLWAHATIGQYSTTEPHTLDMDQILKRWERPWEAD